MWQRVNTDVRADPVEYFFAASSLFPEGGWMCEASIGPRIAAVLYVLRLSGLAELRMRCKTLPPPAKPLPRTMDTFNHVVGTYMVHTNVTAVDRLKCMLTEPLAARLSKTVWDRIFVLQNGIG